jgi:hypothetical protein
VAVVLLGRAFFAKRVRGRNLSDLRQLCVIGPLFFILISFVDECVY